MSARDISAYTLIEILVAMTIIASLFGFGYVSFRDFSRRQAVSGAAKELIGNLRAAQQIALSGQKPADPKCDATTVLNGYYFTVVSGSEYTISAACSGGNVITKDVFMPSGLAISTPGVNPVLFKVLGQGTNIPAGTNITATLTQTGTGNSSIITISSGGEIQ